MFISDFALGRGEGADFRAPLGRAVIGGVIASTVLSLLVIPTVYEIFDEWREWLSRHSAAPPMSRHRPPVRLPRPSETTDRYRISQRPNRALIGGVTCATQ